VLLKQAWYRLFIFVGIYVTKECTCLHGSLICTYDLCTWSLSLPAHKYSCIALKYVWYLPCTLCPSTFVRYGVKFCTLFFVGSPVAAQDGGCDKHASTRTEQRSWHVRVCCIEEGHSVIGKDAMCSGSIRNLPPCPILLLWQWATFLWKVCVCVSTGSHGVVTYQKTALFIVAALKTPQFA
jgi:hypothetical protein